MTFTWDQMLPLFFMAVMGLSLLAYVVLDGYDLGVGILLPFASDEQKDVMVSSIGPFWDANETWLVLGIGVLLIAFPLAHGIVLSALYLPVAVMLIGLVLRGVSFDFRVKARAEHKTMWNRLFALGSLATAMAQGWMLGSYLTGFDHGWQSSLFSLGIALTLPTGYALLGAGWLIWKTTGPLQHDARRLTRWLAPGLLAAIAAVSLYTPLILPQYWARWFDYPGLLVAVPMPLLVAAVAWALWRSIDRSHDWLPFALTLILFLLSMAGLAISIWPDVIPGRLTIWEAAAPRSSQLFMLVGAAVLVPVILAYTAWAYWVFRGKVGEEGYH